MQSLSRQLPSELNFTDGGFVFKLQCQIGLAACWLIAAAVTTPVLAHNDRSRDAPSQTIKARQHFFGMENVDPESGKVRDDRVILSWFSNTSFALALRGRVMLLDAYIVGREDKPARVPTSLQELVELDPEFIFLGHQHADHAELVANIAVRSGATIVASAEGCDNMRVDARNQFGPQAVVDCISVTSAGSLPGAEIKTLSVLEPHACVTAVKHLHAAATPPDPTIPPNPITALGDPREPILWPPGRPASDGVRTVGTNGTVSVLYQFALRGKPGFTFMFNDTAGPLKDQAPHVLDILRSLPRSDVQISLALTPPAPPTAPTPNGLRDVVNYIQAVRPRIFVPAHIDSPAIFGVPLGGSPYWKQGLMRQFDVMQVPQEERPELRWLSDPYDYLRPQALTFDPDLPAWSKERPDRDDPCAQRNERGEHG